MKKAKLERKEVERVMIEVFPTGLCGCGQREEENVELFKLVRDVKKDFGDTATINIMEYGTKIDSSFKRLNEILEASGKKKLSDMGLGAQLFRSLIPMIAINGKIAFASEVPKKEELYAKINHAMRPPHKK
ncbi:MAG: hypothetical protein ACUVTL_07900 [Thermoproteota archaeon]